MRVVLAGASGLIGRALTQSLRSDGHAVLALVRRAPSGPDEARWRPEAGQLDAETLTGADAVVCLSGAGVGDHRWTDSYKDTLLRSRIDTVGTLARTLAEVDGRTTFVSASAVGYYGDTGDREVDERSGPGRGFLADLCVRWEAATQPAELAGLRVAHLRSGLVLERSGGLLGRLRPIVLAGAGGRLGTGRQFMPWISLADEVRAIRFVLESELTGPVNLTGPHPVRNAEFVKALAGLLHRPALVPAPAFALRVALGEFASEVLGGQRAVPSKLAAAGFRHEHADLVTALTWALAQ
jgi:uncharacterized protein (TIGR01777 family)